ncbi:hypothetical protein LNI96_11285 [Tenacibaculum dicentrarchi]|nr:hypothetical protein [Tenacibaculum dicentrarchi]
MRILFEGFKYEIQYLENTFGDKTFYHQDGTILKVGYYYSYIKNEIIYILPKVFLKDNNTTIFNNKCVLDFSKENLDISLKHDITYKWARQISIYFYKGLLEYKNRNSNTTLLNSSQVHNLNSNLGHQEYSYLELVLSFVNFYKKNRTHILYKHIEYVSKQVKNTKWEKTVRKSLPILTTNKKPIYTTFRNKKKIINTEEELFTLYFSILNHLNEEQNLNLEFEKRYSIITGNKFERLKKTGYSKLRKIKYKYFNDTLKKMYHLCEIYFKNSNTASLKKIDEFISISSYNLVFEDMIDKLLTDEIFTYEGETNSNKIDVLRKNADGKIIDHLYSDKSLIDTSNIFAIGDSKYYKPTNVASKESKFKQFTYAKNIIQQNLNLLQKDKSIQNIRYRDEITEGYDITPNFFIYGYIDNYEDFDTSNIKPKGNIIESYHWRYRLFDRDTLFVHQYEINFLYVLKAYSLFDNQTIKNYKTEIKTIFRSNFLSFFSKKGKSGYQLYEYKKDDFEDFIKENFRLINGKCFLTKGNKLIIAIHLNDNTLSELITDFKEYELN